MELSDFVALALVFAFAFLGGHIAQWRRQSIVVGYIVAGVALGTVAAMWGPLGDAMFSDVAHRQLERPMQMIFDLGITFLMFFVGMEISLRRLANAGRSATIVAVSDTGFNLFMGVVIGSLLGWGWKDTFFLAGIILMSSLSVAAKSLIELRRLDNRETEFLLSAMVVEAFIAMVMLSLSTSVVAVGAHGAASSDISEVAIAVAAVYVTLIVVAMFAVPRLARRMEGIRHEEVFILLALGLIFSAAALSWYFGLPFMVGAFFMGIAFSETHLTERLRVRLLSLRDAFTAAFFVGFGMMINLELLTGADTIIIIALAVPLIMFTEMVLTPTVSFFVGLSRREVINMGSALIGRGEDAILFASLGGRLKDAEGASVLPHGSQLYPIAGGICLITSVLTPRLMKSSARVADGLAGAAPGWLKFGGTLVQRTIGVELSTDGPGGRGRATALAVGLVALFASVLALVISFQRVGEVGHLLTAACALGAWAFTAIALRRRARSLFQDVDISDMDLLVKDRRMLANYVSATISLLLLAGVLLAAVASYSVALALVVPAALVPVVVGLARRTHAASAKPPRHMRAHDILERHLEAEGKGVRRRRGGRGR